jgi:hypothetical protein
LNFADSASGSINMEERMAWQVRAASGADADRLALVGSATFLETFGGVLEGSAIIEHCKREHKAPPPGWRKPRSDKRPLVLPCWGALIFREATPAEPTLS